MSAFVAAMDALAADPNIGADASYRAGGTGAPVLLRVVRSSPDRLGDAFGMAVQRFGESSVGLGDRLQAIEGALERSLVRSDEQLAYYVAQAREVIELSLMSQQQIVAELGQLGTPAVAGNGTA